MKKTLAALSVAGLLGASGFVAWSVWSRSGDTLITDEQVKSFDLQAAPSAPSAPSAPAADELRDAVASPVSPRPIATSDMAVARPAPPRAERPAPRPFLTAKLESAARSSRLFVALARSPSRLISRGTALGSPRDLKSFLADKAAVESYLDSALVRVILNSPAAAKALLGSPSLVRAFLASPAMQDPAAVRALLSSRMVAKMIDCPGVQAALADPAVIRRMVADPETGEFLSEHPQAMNALAAAAPAMAGAFSARR